ncbi:immunity protein Imm33 domain-containing protein [Deminuibacter soli]|uniref:Imm33-like domain-containing protein n=1 Tax=Deminuibacter soli TaxID=2291815 RepID=A0A3E1NGM4_9BACT|nr:hypothetical protein [Deminuibacter soli]RFM27037.1 hypothetical protein DXN05_16335 [Deminuibacter soli]
MKHQRKIGSWVVVADCGEALSPQAESLLDAIEQLDAAGPPVQNGTTIQFGWSLLTLRDFNGELHVCEPYFAGDPFTSVMPFVDNTLQVLKGQAALLEQLGVSPVDIRFSDKIGVAKGCLQQDHIYLVREEPVDAEDSGWYIGLYGEPKDRPMSEIDLLSIYEVFNQRYALLDVMTLPPGFRVSFTGDVIEAVMDGNGEMHRVQA